MTDKWIKFAEVGNTGRTRIWNVITTYDDGTILGEIKWFARWRKYAFFPRPDTVYETTCLGGIVRFLNDQMEARSQR